MAHQSFATTTRGLQRQSPPMKLYEKAKRYGIWNPSDIDFTQDRRDWDGFSDLERDVILRLARKPGLWAFVLFTNHSDNPARASAIVGTHRVSLPFALVPTLCVGTPTPTLCVPSRFHTESRFPYIRQAEYSHLGTRGPRGRQTKFIIEKAYAAHRRNHPGSPLLRIGKRAQQHPMHG